MGQHPHTSHSKTNKLINLKTQNGMETNKKYFMDCEHVSRGYLWSFMFKKLRDDGYYLTRIAVNCP